MASLIRLRRRCGFAERRGRPWLTGGEMVGEADRFGPEQAGVHGLQGLRDQGAEAHARDHVTLNIDSGATSISSTPRSESWNTARSVT